ncbi:hypothetical protein ACQY0O_003858 [Thecaphora frezii]
MSHPPFVPRHLGFHERFSLARANIGHPPIVAIVGTFRLAPQHIYALLCRRIHALLPLLPLLRSRVSHAHRPDTNFLPCDSLLASHIVHLGPPTSYTPAQLLQHTKSRWANEVDVTIGPFWNVHVRPLADETGAETDVTVVVLATHHTMVDGKGAMNLYETLLAAQSPLDSDLAQWSEADHQWLHTLTGGLQDGRLPPISDEDLDMRPTWSFLVPVIFREIVLPRLPSWIARQFQRRVWPNYTPAASHASSAALPPSPLPTDDVKSSPPLQAHGAVRKHPSTATAQTRVVSFSRRDFLLHLKRAGAEKGVKTVHGLVHAAALVALWKAVIESHEWKTHHEERVDFVTETPISAREPLRGHGLCTGNYVGDLSYETAVTGSTPFWTLARHYADLLLEPSTRHLALMGMGILGYTPSSPETGMDDFFRRNLQAATPYRCSLGISNLGAIRREALLPCLDVAWAQPPSPIGPAMVLDVVGFLPTQRGGDELGRLTELNVSLSYLDSLDKELVDRFESALFDVLEALAKGIEAEATTVKQVAARAQT